MYTVWALSDGLKTGLPSAKTWHDPSSRNSPVTVTRPFLGVAPCARSNDSSNPALPKHAAITQPQNTRLNNSFFLMLEGRMSHLKAANHISARRIELHRRHNIERLEEVRSYPAADIHPHADADDRQHAR